MIYSPTIEDILKPYSHYPKTIQRAVLLVETNPRFSRMTRGAKTVLKALVVRVSQHDGTRPIRARLDTVALQSDVSTKTVQRTVSLLREIGWMQPVSNGRSEHGVYTSKRYQFSPEFCHLVDLPVNAGKGPAQPPEPPGPQLSDGPVYVDLSFKKDHQGILFQNRTQNPEANPITLPIELQPIVDLGIKPSGVCKLRGLAYAAGHNLADVFAVAKKRLVEIKASAGRAYCYLAKMIGQASDYAARAAQLARIDVEVKAVAQTIDRRRQYAHKRFAGARGLVVRIFDGIAEIVRDGIPAGMIAGTDMAMIYDDIERGKLQEIIQ